MEVILSEANTSRRGAFAAVPGPFLTFDILYFLILHREKGDPSCRVGETLRKAWGADSQLSQTPWGQVNR